MEIGDVVNYFLTETEAKSLKHSDVFVGSGKKKNREDENLAEVPQAGSRFSMKITQINGELLSGVVSIPGYENISVTEARRGSIQGTWHIVP